MSAKSKILLVDDEKDIIHFFSETFQNFEGIEFLSATRASEGIEIARREKPEVIMLDLRMPEMDGEDALTVLKQIVPGSKFIVMTGWDDDRSRKRIEAMGVAAYYSKPVDFEKVITKIMTLVMIKEEGDGRAG